MAILFCRVPAGNVYKRTRVKRKFVIKIMLYFKTDTILEFFGIIYVILNPVFHRIPRHSIESLKLAGNVYNLYNY